MKFSSAIIFTSISSALASGGGPGSDSAVWSFAPTASWTSYTTSVSPAPSLSWSSYSHSKSGHGKESKSWSASAPLTTFSVFPTSSWSTATANATTPTISTPKTPTAPSASAPAQISANAAVHQSWSAAAGIIALAGLALA